MARLSLDRTLNIISRAWGNQRGYAFFPYIDRAAQERTGLRRAGYNEGPQSDRSRPKADKRSDSFRWPLDRAEIRDYLGDHLKSEHDVYWCPSLFEYPTRRSEFAMDEHCLWADLDEADPREMREYPPTIAWESSPDRFQGLWIASEGDFQGASWPGNENQRLTYLLGADPSGWDTTQLLRIPGWPNFKPERRDESGKPPMGKLLWTSGTSYTIDDFASLPEVKGAVSSELTEALESEVEEVDRHKVLAKLKLKLNHTARDLLNAKEVTGDRSGQMWYLMRCLADAGATTTQIVAIVRPTVWNKFVDRADEMKRLIAEASKAVASRSDETVEDLAEDENLRKKPSRLGSLLLNIKRPVWLVEGVLTQGACGFIAGEPKTWKSWSGFDLALSVATGAPFLGHFRVVDPGPVFYIQEEDPLPVLKTRGAKIWSSKSMDKVVLEKDGHIYWLPPEAQQAFDPDINASVQQGITVSDEAWHLWLDETLEQGMDGKPYKLMVIDTLMMTAGDVDENRAQEMTTKIFRPLKVLARKHNVSLIVVHHLGKGDKARMGQRMLGSVANHAWGEDSIYLMRGGRRGEVKMEFESKVAPGAVYRISNLDNEEWNPQISPWSKDDESQNYTSGGEGSDRSRGSASGGTGRKQSSAGGSRSSSSRVSVALQHLTQLGGLQTTKAIAESAGISYQQAYRQLKRETDKVTQTENGWELK